MSHWDGPYVLFKSAIDTSNRCGGLWQAIVNVPEKVAVTAKLSVNYRAPTKADQVNKWVVSAVQEVVLRDVLSLL
jgi:hypothetical protein